MDVEPLNEKLETKHQNSLLNKKELLENFI